MADFSLAELILKKTMESLEGSIYISLHSLLLVAAVHPAYNYIASNINRSVQFNYPFTSNYFLQQKYHP